MLSERSEAQLPIEIENSFEQIDDLNPYDDWLLPFVTIREFKQIDLTNGEKLSIPFFGFLKSQSDNEFTILGPDLRLRSFEKKKQSFVSMDLAEYSKQVIANQSLQYFQPDDSKVERWVHLLVYARAAYHRGDFDSCERFLSVVSAHGPSKRLFLDSRRAFASADFGELLLLLGDMKVTRKQIFAGVQRFLNTFPETQYSMRAVVLRDDLLAMIEQDASHETVDDISSLPIDRQIDECIYLLRELNLNQSNFSEKWDLFRGSASSTPSPAEHLVKIGNRAVPKLLERIGDTKPTRSTPFQSNFTYSDNLLTVGRCAELILSKIAGQPFGDGQSSDLAREQATAWWEEIAIRGEKQYLMERIERGGRIAADSAAALVTKFPEVAFDCIKEVIDRSNDTGVQTKLLEAIGKLPITENISLYIRHQLKSARELETRILAARLLHAVDQDAATEAMLHEFHEMVTNDVGGHWPSEENALIAFLSNSESTTAIAALRDAYDSRKAAERTTIVLSFLDWPFKLDLAPTLSAQIESLLARALLDTERRIGFTLKRKEGNFKNPRNSELAGYLLQHLFPEEYQFEFLPAEERLEEQRIKSINYWRRKNQLPEITNTATP